jgi:hypothetical protein
MSSNTSVTKAEALAYVQAVIAGTLKHFPSGNFTLGGTAFTTASLVALLTSLANAMTALIAAHANVKDAVAALATVESNVGPVLRAYVKLVRAAFNTSTQSLADFGIQPPKARTPRTSEQNAAAAAKAKATRAARSGQQQRRGHHLRQHVRQHQQLRPRASDDRVHDAGASVDVGLRERGVGLRTRVQQRPVRPARLRRADGLRALLTTWPGRAKEEP